jgi:fatty-acyl-CoA synthase
MEPQKSFFVTDWLEKRACLTPDRDALVDVASGEVTTFAGWNERANRTANWLRSLGIRRGDLVSVYASNCPEYLDLFFACNKTGAILHNLNWRLTTHELSGILSEARPVVLVYSDEWRGQVEELRARLPFVRRFVSIGDARAASDAWLGEREGEPSTLRARVDLEMDDPWAIYYTGGTTGLPKGAILTHGNMTWNSVNTVVSWGLGQDDTAPLQLPLFHIGGPNIFMLPLVHVGGRTVLCRGFDADQTFDLIESHGVTHYIGVPTMYVVMQQHPRWAGADFSRLRLAISGGAPCPLPVMERFWERGVDFRIGYGLTEAAGNNFWMPDGEARRRRGSVGHPIFHIDMRIAREDGTVCGTDEEGELLIRGPHVIPGYWNRPAETAAVIRDGWLHTGDIARRDADGFFYIMGRSKEMFISGGENVYPAEVESVIHAHPGVAEAALIAVPHEKWGEVGRAIVVPEPGCDVREDALLGFLAARLAKYKLPHSVVFVDSLPMTAIGKIDKRRLATEHA